MNLFGLCLMLVFSSTMSSPAYLDPAWSARAKQATTRVINPKNGKIAGSAFCVDTAGYFPTNPFLGTRVVGGTPALVVEPGGSGERGLSARVIRGHEESDLALFKTESPVDAARQLSDDANLNEPLTFRARAAYVAMSVGAIRTFKIEVVP